MPASPLQRLPHCLLCILLSLYGLTSAVAHAGSGSIAATVHTQDADRGAGDILQFAIPLAGLGMTLFQDDGEGAKEWAYDIGASTVTTEILKKSFNNTDWGTRPDGGQYSFPSGHATMACAGAGFIGRRYGWEYGGVAMVPAAFVGWSRVDEGVHHWRDVIAGCAIGLGFSYYFVKPEAGYSITPEIYKDGFGLNFNMRY